VASGRATFSGAGIGKVKLTLTARGKSLLRHAKGLKLEAKGTFVPRGGAAVSVVSGFRLR